MNTVLPDVSMTDTSPVVSPLEWVGMQGIDMPIWLEGAEGGFPLVAKADVQVNLPQAHIKGIHMSRLYLLLDSLGNKPVSPAVLHQLLQKMLDSHKDCGSSSARLSFSFELLLRRPALRSEELAGWKSYPVMLSASLVAGIFNIELEVAVAYSSTCPCSAALSRKLLEQRFINDFKDSEAAAPADIAQWLSQYGSLATPHSQRSEARVAIGFDSADSRLELKRLIDRIEDAVQTPLQTAVKRIDEQAFAELNGANLMFVEDAARRIQSAIDPFYSSAQVHVRHFESLHQHDASAWSHTQNIDL